MTQPIKPIFGGACFPLGPYADPVAQAEALALLENIGVTAIDSARLYIGSEAAMGQHAARKSFAIDTKVNGGWEPGTATKDGVLRDLEESLQRLQIDQVDVFYIHGPDATIPIRETLEGVNEAYKRGWFRRFGLSNFDAGQVQEVYDVATENGFVKPTVYQGNYNAVARHFETLLLPTLRKLGIAFYAYSPIAGGFLTKSTADIDAGAGRFNASDFGGMYLRLYSKPSLRAALDEWNAIAEAEGVSKAELAYRWIAYDSALKPEFGDAFTFGASKLSYIEQLADGLKKGGLSQSAVERIDKIWESVKDDAPVDNWTNGRA